ncbi:uncharacterized protein LOC131598698 [Vicia villosa]|uniref:uncharacterized protein LOC131598698 n=1 Tax=Vicia villosa TaxID=3911 RepID=UPI00273CE117|nr:uncharacterized protein LOC131598698 [Vicia villosa]
MRNNLEGVNRLTDDDFTTYHEKLGTYGFIYVTKSQRYIGLKRDWMASYTIDGSEDCSFRVMQSKEVTKDGILSTHKVYFQLLCKLSSKCSCIHFRIQKDEAFLASPAFCINLDRDFEYIKKKHKKSIIGSGYVMETRAYHYSSGKIRGLLVLEEVRKRGDNEKPCRVIVAHYFTVCSFNIFSINNRNVGLCVIINIEPCEKVGLKVTVEGPSHHPTGALHNMFEQVMKNEIWKPTMLCSNLSNIERQLFRRQPEREDDDVSFPPPRGHGGKSKRAVVIDSGGSVTGNGNCNVVIGDMNIYK